MAAVESAVLGTSVLRNAAFPLRGKAASNCVREYFRDFDVYSIRQADATHTFKITTNNMYINYHGGFKNGY